jgi:hypothetical protein
MQGAARARAAAGGRRSVRQCVHARARGNVARGARLTAAALFSSRGVRRTVVANTSVLIPVFFLVFKMMH